MIKEKQVQQNEEARGKEENLKMSNIENRESAEKKMWEWKKELEREMGEIKNKVKGLE